MSEVTASGAIPTSQQNLTGGRRRDGVTVGHVVVLTAGSRAEIVATLLLRAIRGHAGGRHRSGIMTSGGSVLYTAKTQTTGGRENGVARSADGYFKIRFSTPGTGWIGAS